MNQDHEAFATVVTEDGLDEHGNIFMGDPDAAPTYPALPFDPDCGALGVVPSDFNGLAAYVVVGGLGSVVWGYAFPVSMVVTPCVHTDPTIRRAKPRARQRLPHWQVC